MLFAIAGEGEERWWAFFSGNTPLGACDAIKVSFSLSGQQCSSYDGVAGGAGRGEIAIAATSVTDWERQNRGKRRRT